mmetsp:Transcript_56093/g.135435  ORF Transcript_56093/g.135435 Transcript_56093/m.135435 type:complete len:284 (-) Transcript_56093:257-1108(-)
MPRRTSGRPAEPGVSRLRGIEALQQDAGGRRRGGGRRGLGLDAPEAAHPARGRGRLAQREDLNSGAAEHHGPAARHGGGEPAALVVQREPGLHRGAALHLPALPQGREAVRRHAARGLRPAAHGGAAGRAGGGLAGLLLEAAQAAPGPRRRRAPGVRRQLGPHLGHGARGRRALLGGLRRAGRPPAAALRRPRAQARGPGRALRLAAGAGRLPPGALRGVQGEEAGRGQGLAARGRAAGPGGAARAGQGGRPVLRLPLGQRPDLQGGRRALRGLERGLAGAVH